MHYLFPFLVIASAICCALAGAQDGAKSIVPILAMDRLNTPANENHPCPAPDGLQFIYSSDASGRDALYLAGRVGPGQPIMPDRVLDELSTEGHVHSAFLLPRGSDSWEYLYFSTQLNTDPKQPNFDIYRVGRFDPKRHFQGNNAASPVQAICTPADEAFPWLVADGKEMYFSRRTPQGWQQFRAYGTQPRVFTQVESLEIPVGYHHACLNRAKTKMIVQGPLKAGASRQGLFLLKRPSTRDGWLAPEPLISINSDSGKIGTCSPRLSADTRYLYFASDRPGGKGGLDLYVVAVNQVPELK